MALGHDLSEHSANVGSDVGRTLDKVHWHAPVPRRVTIEQRPHHRVEPDADHDCLAGDASSWIPTISLSHELWSGSSALDTSKKSIISSPPGRVGVTKVGVVAHVSDDTSGLPSQLGVNRLDDRHEQIRRLKGAGVQHDVSSSSSCATTPTS
jgi:hypothetical protein